MPTDPSDARPPRTGQKPRSFPEDWLPDPPGSRASMGMPADDVRRWWRLQPGVRGEDGRMVRRSIIHGGTCKEWPAGRHPADWSFHNRPEVRRFLERPDEVIPCPLCRPEVGL